MKSKKGFTLIELLVVIALIGIVGTIIGINVFSSLKKAKEKAFKNEVINVYNLAMSQKDVDKYLPLFNYKYDGINAKLLLDKKDNFYYKIIFDSTLETMDYLCVYDDTYKLEISSNNVNINVNSIKHSQLEDKSMGCLQ